MRGKRNVDKHLDEGQQMRRELTHQVPVAETCCLWRAAGSWSKKTSGVMFLKLGDQVTVCLKRSKFLLPHPPQRSPNSSPTLQEKGVWRNRDVRHSKEQRAKL